MVQCKDHICPAHTVILQCLNLILQLYNIIGWERFQDDILTIWTHGSDTLESFLDYLNQIDSTGKIKFPGTR